MDSFWVIMAIVGPAFVGFVALSAGIAVLASKPEAEQQASSARKTRIWLGIVLLAIALAIGTCYIILARACAEPGGF